MDNEISRAPTPQEAHMESINKIWTTVALISLYLNVNILLVTQGSHLHLPGPLPKNVRESAAIYGTWAAGPVFLVTLIITLYYIQRSSSHTWSSRFPVAFDLSLLVGDSITKWYQRFFVFVFIVVPLYCQGHFVRKTMNGIVIDKAKGTIVASDWGSHLFSYSDFSLIFTKGNDFRFHSEVTYFPFWQSWTTLLLLLLMVWLFLRVFRALAK